MGGPGPGPEDSDFQARLMRSFFEESHVSMWACDAEFRIVLWNRGAASVYGRSADSVLGHRYDELFIDEAEREQSLADCKAIIESGTRYTNFLALDHDARGVERQMLTNCFRITDPLTGEHYQAEIGVSIADLEVAQKELRTLRELGLEQVLERKQTLRIKRTHLETLLSQAEAEIRTRADARVEEIEHALQSISPRLRTDSKTRYEDKKRAIRVREKELLEELRGFRPRLAECGDLDETEALEADLTPWGDWVKRLDGAAER